MNLQFDRVESFKVFGLHFTIASRWNGLEEWHDAEGRRLIVALEQQPNAGFDAAFRAVLQPSNERAPETLRVVSGHPDLLAELSAQAT